MTRTQRLVYGFFVHAIGLLIAYALVSLVGAVKFLGADPLATTFPYHQVSAFANALLNLAMISGLLGGGVYAAASARADNQLGNERLLGYSYLLWRVVVLLSAAAGLPGLLEARVGLELPPLLDIGVGLVIVLVTVNALQTSINQRMIASIVPLWAFGMALLVLSILIGLLPPADFIQDRILRALSVGIQLYIAYPVAVVALAFWLMHRFSNITPRWAQMSVYTLAGLVGIAGALMTVSSFYTLIESDLVRGIGGFGVIVIPVVYLMLASYSYRAFSDRNTNATLSAQWLALGVLLLLIGAGVFGGASALPGIYDYVVGTRISDLQTTLMKLAVVAVLLGIFNQVSAEMLGQNRRVTGLMPFWLVSFGAVGGGLALAGAGIVQVYLERLLSVGYLETQTLIIPLYTLWFIGLVSLALGIVVYALGFWARRPRFRGSVESP